MSNPRKSLNQPIPEIKPVPQRRNHTRKIHQRRSTVQLTKLPIQSLHLGAMRTCIVTLLSILGLLVFALPHCLGSERADICSVDEPRHENDRQRRQHVQSIRRFQYAGETRRTGSYGRPLGGERQCQHRGQSGLQAKINREQRGLKSCKLRAWQRSECHDATNERLEYLRS